MNILTLYIVIIIIGKPILMMDNANFMELIPICQKIVYLGKHINQDQGKFFYLEIQIYCWKHKVSKYKTAKPFYIVYSNKSIMLLQQRHKQCRIMSSSLSHFNIDRVLFQLRQITFRWTESRRPGQSFRGHARQRCGR